MCGHAQAGFEDPHSSIVSYFVSVTDEGGAVAFSEDVGLATEATAFGLPLVDGIVYTIAVTATNGAGLVSAPVTTEHVLDRSPPVAGAVRDGSSLVADIDYQGTQQVAFNWDAFTEPHTAVTYTVKICEVLAAPEVCVVATPVGNATSFSGAGLPLEPRVSYFVHITGTNGAGASDSASSDGEIAAAAVAVAFRRLTPSHILHHLPGFVIDSSDPVAGVVRDGMLERDLQLQGSWDFGANWDAWVDEESPIERYEWCLGTAVGLDDVLACTTVVR